MVSSLLKKKGKSIRKSRPVSFNSSNRTDTTIPNGVEGIGSHVIHGETMLIGTDLPELIKILNGDPFIWHDVKSIVISNNITKIGKKPIFKLFIHLLQILQFQILLQKFMEILLKDVHHLQIL